MHAARLLPHAASVTSKKLGCYYRGVRVGDWVGYLSISVLGYCLGASAVPDWTNYLGFLQLVVSSSLFLAFAFLMNNCYDVRADVNQFEKLAKNPIASGRMSQEEGIVLSVGLAAVGLLVSLSSMDLLSKLVYVSLIIWGGTYSAPPVRLKGMPVVDVISHGLALGSGLFLYGFLVASGGSMTIQAGLVAASLFLYSMIFELRNHLSDLEADLISGTKTTVCWLGRRRSEQILSLFTYAPVLVLFAVTYLTLQSWPLLVLDVLMGVVIMYHVKGLGIGTKLDLISIMVYSTPVASNLLFILLSLS